MPTVREIDGLMTEYAPKQLSEPWDNDGIMLCGNLDAEADSAVISLEVNSDVIDFAIENRAQCIVTHHPFIFRPIKNVQGSTFSDLERLMLNGISVLSYHTRLDCAKGGVNDVLAEKLGLLNTIPFSADESGAAMGRIGSLTNEMTACEFAAFVKKTLGCEGLRFSSSEGKIIRRVAVLGGAGKDFLRGAAASGADAFVSADLSHNTYLDGTSLGIAVIDAGHYSTENPVTELISEIIGTRLGIKTIVFDVGAPYREI